MKLKELGCFFFSVAFIPGLFAEEAAVNADSVACFKAMEKCTIKENREAARSLADIGLYREAMELLESPADTVEEEMPEKKRKMVMEARAGVDYYRFEDTDTSLYSLYRDTLFGRSDTAVFGEEKPWDVFGEGSLSCEPGRFFIRKINPLIRISNLAQKEKMSLVLGDGAGGIRFRALESFTRYLDRPQKDSSDFLELQAALAFEHPAALLGLALKPYAEIGGRAGFYKHERPGYVSTREAALLLGIRGIGARLFSDLGMEVRKRLHSTRFDSLDAFILRPDFQLDYTQGRANVAFSISRETARVPGRNSANDVYTTAELDLSCAAAERFGIGLDLAWESTQTGYGDIFYFAHDTLFSSPDTVFNYNLSGTVDTLVRPYEEIYWKYGMDGRRLSLKPRFSWEAGAGFSGEVSYEYGRGRYPRVETLGGAALEYGIPSLEDPCHFHKVENSVRRAGRDTEAGAAIAWERNIPTSDRPMEPENNVYSGSAEARVFFPRGFALDAAASMEIRIYLDGNDPHRRVTTRSLNLSLRKSVP